MKPYSQAMLNNLRSRGVRFALCWQITRMDGVVFAFTEHDQDLDINGVTYISSNSFTGTAIDSKLDFSVDNLQASAIVSSNAGGLSESDLKIGKFDGAKVLVFGVDWSNPSNTVLPLRRGRVGDITVSTPMVQVEVRGLMQLIQQIVGRTFTLECSADLGDVGSVGPPRCKVQLTPPVWTKNTIYALRNAHDASGGVVAPTVQNGFFFEAHVVSGSGLSGATEPVWPLFIGGTVVDNQVTWTAIKAHTLTGTITGGGGDTVTDTARTEVAGWWKYGTIQFTSGLNEGYKIEIKSFSAGSIQMLEPAPFDFAPGDGYIITVGCDKLFATCKGKFDNHYNSRGFHLMPTSDDAYQYPDSPV